MGCYPRATVSNYRYQPTQDDGTKSTTTNQPTKDTNEYDMAAWHQLHGQPGTAQRFPGPGAGFLLLNGQTWVPQLAPANFFLKKKTSVITVTIIIKMSDDSSGMFWK